MGSSDKPLTVIDNSSNHCGGGGVASREGACGGGSGSGTGTSFVLLLILF